jgi:hypothetical protein
VPPKSKLHLVGSQYSFDKEIDINEINEITDKNEYKLENLKLVG